MTPEEAAKSLNHPDKFYLLCDKDGKGVKGVLTHKETKGWTGPIKVYKKGTGPGSIVPVGIKGVFEARIEKRSGEV